MGTVHLCERHKDCLAQSRRSQDGASREIQRFPPRHPASTSRTYLLQHLELVPEALHLLLQVLKFVLLHAQQHLGSRVPGSPGAGATRPRAHCSLPSLCLGHLDQAPRLQRPTCTRTRPLLPRGTLLQGALSPPCPHQSIRPSTGGQRRQKEATARPYSEAERLGLPTNYLINPSVSPGGQVLLS